MAGQVVANQPAAASYGFEIVEGDYNTKVEQSPINPWIDPSSIKLRHRIGRGPFGDIWLATHHQETEDYQEYHEVAVKTLHPFKEDDVKVVLKKIECLFSKCKGIQGVCWLQGVSIINGKICIIMKFYEGSVGDKMARLKGGKLSLSHVLRYGIDVAEGIIELHSKGILALNLKPSNFLLNEENRAILGDIGIPFVLLGISLPSSDMTRRLGTPNYMAPEQWQPEIRGPVSFETDSWGFGCSVIEMLTGSQPWCGMTIDEICNSVVKREEKPRIRLGLLPPAIENVIIGCFENDFRSRPSMADILHAFKSSQNAVYNNGEWTGLGSRTITEKPNTLGYSEWFVSKDILQIGDTVRSRKPPNSCKPENMDIPKGTIVGLERDTERSGSVLVRVHGIHDPVRVQGSTLERVTFGLAAGDWVRLKKEDKKHSPVGILHSINRDGTVAIGFIGVDTLWKGTYTDLEMAESLCMGQFVRLKSNIFSPRFEWPRKMGGEWTTGKIWRVLPNGCLLVKFPSRLTLTFWDEGSTFMADPAEVELVAFNTCNGIVKKYQHLEDFHWGVRPFLMALGIFTAMKLGIFVGKKMGRSKVKKAQVIPTSQDEKQHVDSHKSGWLPPNVANIIFREGGNTTATR